MPRHQPIIAVDLDKTLAHYEKWVSPAHIGPPIPDMLQRVKTWLSEGKTVVIFTARVSHNGSLEEIDEAAAAKQHIQNWCIEHLGQELPVTCIKSKAMIEFWDDRAVQIIPNTGRRVDGL